MAQTIQLKRSSVAGNKPGSSDLALGEIAINTADGAVYIKKGDGTIVAVHDNDILHIDTTNSRIGIGKTNPTVPLDVVGQINATGHLFSSSDVYAGGNTFIFGNSVSNGDYLQFETDKVKIYSGGTAGLTVKDGGNVGIGTDSPSVKFEVNGGADAIAKITGTSTAARLDLATTTHHVFMQVIESDGRFRIYDQTAANEYLTISNAGNVGIGTDSPAQLLDVDGTARFGTSTYRITLDGKSGGGYFKIGTTSNDDSLANFGAFSSSFVLDTTQVNGFVFKHNGAEKMRLNSSGNLGIGTTSPLTKLDTSGTIRATGLSTISGGAGTELRYDSSNTFGGVIVFDRGTSSYQELRLEGSAIKLKEAGTDVFTVDGGNATLTGNLIFDDGQITSDGTNFIIDGASGKEVIVSSARDVRIVIDDNNDDTNNEFQIFKHNTGSSNKILNLTQAGALTLNSAYTFPTADGTSNQVLTTDGSGQLSFADVSGASGISVTNNVNNRVLTGDGTNANAEANLTFDGTTLDITGNFVIDHGNWTSSDVVNITTDQFDAGATFQTGEFLLFGDHDGSADKMLSLKRAGTDVFMVDRSGQVGIGTDSPAQKLHVAKSGEAYARVESTSGGGARLQLKTETVGYAAYSRLDFIYGASDTVAFSINGGDAVNTMAFDVAGSERMRIDSSGNVMIGNTSAGAKLDIRQDSGYAIRAENGTGHYFRVAATGQVEITNNAVDGTASLLLNCTEDSALASPILEFNRDSASPADADYLGQIKFTGENDQDQNVLYAKITGKIQDATDTTEDGIIEFMTKKAGANNISARLNATEFQLINGTGLSVAGDATVTGNTTITGNLTVNGTTTTLNTATLDVEDKNITLNKGSGDTSGSADGAGITIQDAVDASTDATILWNAANDRFDFSDHILVPDNKQIKVGSSGNDFRLYHDGSSSIIDNGTGHLDIKNSANDADIRFFTDDQSGGLTEYLRLDGGDGRIKTFRNTRIADQIYLTFGNNDDLQIRHDATNSEIKNFVGDLTIQNSTDDGDILFRSDDGSGGTAEYMRLDGGIVKTVFSKNFVASDNVKGQFGNSADLSIYHTGSHSVIDNATGNIDITNNTNDGDIFIKSDDGSGGVATYIQVDGGTGSVNLRNYGNVKLATTSSGIDVTGHINVTGQTQAFKGVSVAGLNPSLYLQDTEGSNAWHIGHNGAILYVLQDTDANGTYNTIAAYWDSSNNYVVDNGYIRSDGGYYLDTTQVMDTSRNLVNIAGLTTSGQTILGSGTTSAQSSDKLYIGGSGLNGADAAIYFGNNGSGTGVGWRFFYQGSNDGNLNRLIIRSENIGSPVDALSFTQDGEATFGDNVIIKDSKRLQIGDASNGDLSFIHDGTNTYIQNTTGNLDISNTQDDGDIYFKSDDGSGGITTYFYIDGSDSSTRFTVNPLKFNDNIELLIGSSSDLRILHNATDTHIVNNTGDFYISNSADDKDIIFRSDDGSGGMVEYFRLDGSLTKTYFEQNVQFNDSVKIQFGAGADLSLNHNGTHSFIDNNTGSLYISSTNSVQIEDNSGNDMITAAVAGAVTLFHNGSSKLATTSSGITVTGAIAETTHGTILDSSANLTNINNVYASGYRIGSTQIVDSSRNLTNIGTISSGAITASGKIKASGSRFESTTTDNSHREYVLTTGAGGGDFFLGQIEYNDAADGAIKGTIYFAYDYGTSTQNTIVHFHFAQRNGTARGTWWFEDDDNDSSSNRVTAVLIDDGSGGMFVWIRVADYGRVAVVAETRHGGNWASSGSLTAGTITTGTTLFNTADDPTAEMHIGKLYAHDNVYIPDTKYLLLGDGEDLQLTHNATDSYISNGTGNLYIQNSADDKDIIIRTDDGSGSVTAYMTFDGSHSRVSVAKEFIALDNVPIRVGSGGDAEWKHDGSNTYLINKTGDFYIQNTADDKDIVFQSDDGSGGVSTYFQLDGSEVVTSFLKTTRHLDNVKAMFGSSNDLQIYHDGSNSYITDSGTGNLRIGGTQVDILNPDSNEFKARFITDGAVELYHNNSKKFETTSTGIKVSSDVEYRVKLAETTTSATTQTAIHTITATDSRSARYTVQVTNSTDSTYMVSEILLIHDGTTPSITEYGVIFTGSAREAAFDADISSGSLRLLATPASTDTMVFKVVAHSIDS